ncbi:MAG: histidine kinase, partial [Gammaproteobacteria bacterium]|nr:histidine kinase [Gammaproteobacteria bacterium]
RHLLGLINNVLDLSRIEAGELTLTIAEYSVREVLQNVYVAVEPLAAEKRLALELDAPEALPVARGDEQRITQVLLNIAGNAVKFCEQGAVRLRAREEDGRLLLSVSDTGPGIAPEE